LLWYDEKIKMNDDGLKERANENMLYNIWDFNEQKEINFILFLEMKRKWIWYFYLRIAQSLHDGNTIGDWLVLSVSIKFTDGCRTPNCKKAFIIRIQEKISNVYYNINLIIKFTNGQTINVILFFFSYEQPSTGKKAFNHLYKIK
jgi:hypothetical protein